MPKPNTKISRTQFEGITKDLEALQPKVQTEFTNKDIVTQHKELIKHAIQELGYTFEDIADILNKHDATLTASTLRTYLRDAQPKPAASKKRKAGVSVQPRQSDRQTPTVDAGARPSEGNVLSHGAR